MIYFSPLKIETTYSLVKQKMLDNKTYYICKHWKHWVGLSVVVIIPVYLLGSWSCAFPLGGAKNTCSLLIKTKLTQSTKLKILLIVVLKCVPSLQRWSSAVALICCTINITPIKRVLINFHDWILTLWNHIYNYCYGMYSGKLLSTHFVNLLAVRESCWGMLRLVLL